MDSERLELLNKDAQAELYLFILGILTVDETVSLKQKNEVQKHENYKNS